MVECPIAPFKLDLKIPFETDTLARIAYDALRVDKEPNRSCTKKSLKVSKNILLVNFESSDLKNLRVGVNNFFKLLILVSKTINLFGPPVSDVYEHY